MPPVPQYKRKRIAGFKNETTVGTAVSLTGSDTGYLVWDAEIQPEFLFEERRAQGGGSLAGVQSQQRAALKFKSELYGGSSAPPWASVLLVASAMVPTSLVFNPFLSPPGANGVKTATMYLWEDGGLKAARGCMFNPVFKFSSGKKCWIEWTGKGIWIPPSDVSLPTLTIPSSAPLQFVSSGLSLGSWTPRVADVSIDLGNKVEWRADSTDPSGYICAEVVDRITKGTMDPESSLVGGANDTYGKLLASTLQTFALSLGAALNGVAFAGPKCQISKAQEADRDELQTDHLDLQFCISSVRDDDFSITFQ
jgi:hypothetical protein